MVVPAVECRPRGAFVVPAAGLRRLVQQCVGSCVGKKNKKCSFRSLPAGTRLIVSILSALPCLPAFVGNSGESQKFVVFTQADRDSPNSRGHSCTGVKAV